MSDDPVAAVLRQIAARDALDVGCGTGAFTRTLAAHLGQWRSIVGIDPDKDSIDEARRLTGDYGATPGSQDGVRYRVMSALEMPWADARFDLVCISNTLHHLEDPTAVLREMVRVARPGADLVVQELVSDGLSDAEANERDVHHLKARIDELNGRCHRPTYSRAEVEALLGEIAPASRIERHTTAIVTDEEPGEPGSPRVGEVLGFLGEYLEFVRDEPAYPEFQAEASRISRNLLAYGIATPPRLLVRLRLATPREYASTHDQP